MVATTPYNRLSSRSSGLVSSGDEGNHDDVYKPVKEKKEWMSKGKQKVLVASALALVTLGLLGSRRQGLADTENSVQSLGKSFSDSFGQGIESLKSTWDAEGTQNMPEGNDNVPVDGDDEFATPEPENPSLLKAMEQATIEAADPGPQDGQPSQILVENNDGLRPQSIETNVDWDDVLAEAPTRKHQVLKEWNIELDTPFRTVEEFRELIGFKCPPRRHCTVKQRRQSFIGGGEWKNLSAGRDGVEMVFTPHNCWVYNFDGDEMWTSGNEEVQRVVIFVDGDTENSIMKEVSMTSELFHYMPRDLPSGAEDELAFRSELNSLLEKATVGPQVQVHVTLVVNWVNSGMEYSLVRLLQRLTIGLDASSAEVVWVNQPFYNLEQSRSAIAINEAMDVALKKIWSKGSVHSDPVLIKREPKRLMAAGNGNNIQVTINFQEIAQNPEQFALFDVRNKAEPLEMPRLEYFKKYGFHLPLLRVSNGWTPNLPLDTKIVLFCNSGFNANKAARILRLHGYKNAKALALSTVKSGDTDGVSAPMVPRSDAIVTAVDLFAPSIGIPEANVPAGASPGSLPIMVQYFSNWMLNVAYKNEIVASAGGPSVNHVCHIPGQCTSCFLTIGSIPSDRITFELIKNYFTRRSVATKIVLSKDHKIWEGNWVTFLKHNENTQLTVRKNYSTVRTRKFEKQPLPEYLQHAHIVTRSENGEFKETGEAATVDENGLPIYAGNNKLDKFSMAEYDFKYPEWIRRSSLQRPAMWIGNKGSLSSLHVDHTNRGNLAYQVLGRKTWHLFPPYQRSFLYGRKVGVVIWSALIDPELYSEEKQRELPLFKLGLPDSVKIEVNEGEMLYNPDEWWHVVYNTEASLMLNFWLKASVEILPPPQNP